MNGAVLGLYYRLKTGPGIWIAPIRGSVVVGNCGYHFFEIIT